MTELHVPSLLWLVAFQLGLYAVAWGLCSLLLRESRVAVAHWGGFLLLLGLGLWLAGGRDEPRDWLHHNGTNVLALIGFAAMRRGTERFMRVRSSDVEQWAIVGPAVLLVAWLGPHADAAPARITLAYAVQAWTVLRCMFKVREALAQEFGRAAIACTFGPGVVIGILQLLLAGNQLLNWEQPQEMQRNTAGNLGLMMLYLGGCAFFNIGFMAMMTLRLVAELRRASMADPLTGLLNRRALDQVLAAEWQRHRRQRQPLALMLLDVDHFKRINDTRGHSAGDEALVNLADLLRHSVRTTDAVARLGGEEFLIVLPGAERAQAAVLAERLRRQAAELLGTTVSIGIAQARAEDIAVQALVERSDQALYRAKAQGRNRVESDDGAQAMPAPAR
ncbi:MAG: diguanylate cyclase [Aquabacterium sp.]